MAAKIYSHLTGRLQATPPRPAQAPRHDPELTRMRAETQAREQRMTEALQDAAVLRAELQAERSRRTQAEGEIAQAEDRARQAEQRALEAAVRAGEAEGATAGLRSALANAQATNTKLAAMKPPPPPKPAPPTPATPWKMEVHRDGVGNIREIIATPQGK